jgi:hypothetical protein
MVYLSDGQEREEEQMRYLNLETAIREIKKDLDFFNIDYKMDSDVSFVNFLLGEDEDVLAVSVNQDKYYAHFDVPGDTATEKIGTVKYWIATWAHKHDDLN